MKQFFKRLLTKLLPQPSSCSTTSKSEHSRIWRPEWSHFLERHVSFYQNLTQVNRQLFEKRVLLFLHSTAVLAEVPMKIKEGDRLLIAASAIIPVWGFPKWHYFNLKSVYLLPAAFNERLTCGVADSCITGMVGTGAMAGKMVLSKPHLYQGFLNPRDKQNVGIHEFVHLIDMADGKCDGYPELLKSSAFAIPWLDFARHKMNEINAKKSNIRQYGATNSAEFFSVASEYFFERPQMLKQKHPKLCHALEQFYRQNVDEITNDHHFKKNAPCPCGSRKKYKRCCFIAQ